MNWKKIFGNIAGVTVLCLAAQKATGSPDWVTLGMGLAMCIIANQVGLHQKPPASD